MSSGTTGQRGAAYVFVRSGSSWSLETKLAPAALAADDQFGRSLALSGDTLAVGAHKDNGSRGAVYVFTRSGSTWSLQDEISSTDHADNPGLSASTLGAWGAFGLYLEPRPRQPGGWGPRRQRLPGGYLHLHPQWQQLELGDQAGSGCPWPPMTSSATQWPSVVRLWLSGPARMVARVVVRPGPPTSSTTSP